FTYRTYPSLSWMTRSVGTVLPTESSAPNPRYLPLLHTGIPLARLGPTAWLWCADVPAFPDGLPDLLDGQRLDGQGLRPLDVARALDRAEGGFLRRVERFPHDFPVAASTGSSSCGGTHPPWA